jgi:hypothetical protein
MDMDGPVWESWPSFAELLLPNDYSAAVEAPRPLFLTAISDFQATDCPAQEEEDWGR